MTEKQIPEYIDPHRYAEQGINLKGKVFLSEMKRLGASVLSANDVANVNLHFGVDEQGLLFLKGQVQATLCLQCQRCMEPYNYEIISDFVLGIVKTMDEVNKLPTHYEPVLIQEEGLALRELVEDEIILNLPIIPKHAPEMCPVKLPVIQGAEEKENPFHVLKVLKKDK